MKDLMLGNGAAFLGACWLALPLAGQAAPALARKTLVGKPATEWQATNWLNTAPLTLRDLRGKVVLVRWWTAPDCPYCAATAPALNEFYRAYQSQGLEVIGFYHHKSSEPLKPEAVERYTRNFGFNFPVATHPRCPTFTHCRPHPPH